jgi:hypothetical protein
MRSLLLVGSLGAALLTQLAAASAAPHRVTGQVTDTHSRWTADGSRIVTEATVRSDDGAELVVSQLGGTVDGLTMRVFHGAEPLAPGMRVTVAAHEAHDLSRRLHLVLDDVKVLALPPGYVRTGPTMAGKYLYWESGCVFLTVDSAGSKSVPGEAELTAVDASIETWNAAATGCSYISLVNEGRRAVEVGRDNVNVIKFRDVSWCRPATKDDPARCHPESAAAITTATYVDDSSSSRDGAIVDADIEINGVHFAVAVDGQTTSSEPCIADVRNTLTHELGHLLGIEHTCLAATDPPDRVDHLGRPVPRCSATSDPTILNATMYNFQECGETKKETLEADDIAAVCGIYPAASDPRTCSRVGDTSGCCQTGGGPGGSLVLSALVGLLLMTPFWRRRR